MKLAPKCRNEPGNVVLLNRSLYGVRKARKAWSTLLRNTLKEQGLEQCRGDPCISRLMGDGSVRITLAVHVDDTIVGGTGQDCESLWISL